MTEIYRYSWTCAACDEPNHIERSKVDAAFNHWPSISPCVKCAGQERAASSAEIPDIDIDLLEIWFADPELYFLDQDEDLIIAGSPMQVFKDFLAKPDRPQDRLAVIGPVLAVKLFDDEFESASERDWCIDFLSKNKDHWEKSSYDYILEEILPILNGLTQKENKPK